MTDKQKYMYENVVKRLNEYRMRDADMYGIFFMGTQLAIGKTRIYKKKGAARNRIADLFGYYGDKGTKEDYKEVIDILEEKKFLEYRKLGDRTPKFPNEVVEPEQVKRFEEMLDASDNEMVTLAITILGELTKTEKDE